MKQFIFALCILVVILSGALYPVETVQKNGPSWYQDAVVYEAFARSFYDTDQDGIGDIKGLIAKLDYLNDGNPNTTNDLGVNAIWLMPIFSAPSYHGYDVTDYYQINKEYGTMADFDLLLQEAHKRGIKIILDLVLNHTSNKHPFFLESAKGPDNPKRDWYIWKKEKPQGWGQPWSAESNSDNVWHPLGGYFYYGVFYFGMPDLNYNNPEVIAEVKKIIKFWLAKGVDGFRLDAIRYLVEDGPKLGQQETDATRNVMAEFYNEAKKINPDCLLIGEIWANMDTVASYFKSLVRPAQVDTAFNFDLAAAIIDGLKNNVFKGIDVTLDVSQSVYPKDAMDSIFLTNHDMDRIATIINGDMGKLKLAASMLLTLPGTPYIYYGEEIAMRGSKPDEMIRRPMRWDESPLAGFTIGPKPWIKPDPTAGLDVATMQNDKNSLLQLYIKMIRLRTNNIALRRGSYLAVKVTNPQVYAFLRSHPDQTLLVVHNFSAGKITGLALPGTLGTLTELSAKEPVTSIDLEPYESKLFQVKSE